MDPHEAVAPEPNLSPPPLPELPLPQPLPPVPVPVPVPAKAYPGLGQALGLLVLLAVVQLVLVGLIMVVDQLTQRRWTESAAMLGLVNLLSFGLVCTLAGRRLGVTWWSMLAEPPPPGTFTISNLMALVQAVFGHLFCAVGFVFLIGGKNIGKSDYMERLNKVMSGDQPWWILVPLLVIVAPLTEEILFRGQMLRGFLARYAPPLAIGASAVFFSAMHLNPVQIPATLMLGILSGVLYARTRSIWPSIVAHAVNNAIPALALVRGAGKGAAAKPELDLSLGMMLGLIAVGLVLWWSALAALRRGLPLAAQSNAQSNAQSDSPSDAMA
jgi:membrane protease YdiL (CAAX protease family)